MTCDVAALALFPHYWDHLAPVVEALRDRGVNVRVLSTWRNAEWAEHVHPANIREVRPKVWLTAGKVDADLVAPEPTVYLEHGVGQTYDADQRGLGHDSYSTGRVANAVLFLCPNRFVAQRRANRQPESGSIVVGVPKLDHLWAHGVTGWHGEVAEHVVAFAWHWHCELVPETMTAWDHYREHMVKQVVLPLRRRGFHVVAHAHPRIARRIRYHSERMGMEWWDAEDVLINAAVLAFDNTSLGYEFASMGRPTIVMNAPWYRKDVHHGLRFWECLPGEQVDEASQIVDAVDVAHSKRDGTHPCIDALYPLRDGRASVRSAEAITLLL